MQETHIVCSIFLPSQSAALVVSFVRKGSFSPSSSLESLISSSSSNFSGSTMRDSSDTFLEELLISLFRKRILGGNGRPIDLENSSIGSSLTSKISLSFCFLTDFTYVITALLATPRSRSGSWTILDANNLDSDCTRSLLGWEISKTAN